MKVGFGVTAARLVLIGVTLALVVASSVSAASGQQPPARDGSNDIRVADPRTRFVPRELVVRFKEGVSDDQRAEALRANGAERKRQLRVPGLELVRLAPGRSVEATARALSNRPEVAYAEPNWIYRATATPNDPRFNELWGLNQSSDVDIDAPEAWNTTTGSANVIVAVVDTGVAYLHTDLAPNMWSNADEVGGDGDDDDGNGYVDDVRGWDTFDNDNDPADTNGHGTHVAGTIGARGNDAFGVPGVNWTVKIMPLRVLGPGGGTNAQVTEGFAYAADNGAKVVNASLGCAGCFSQAMKDVIDARPNTLYVVAAGNSSANNDTNPHYPCAYTSTNLVCVAATSQTDGLASFSNYGATSVDLGAPGVDILSTWRGLTDVFNDGLEAGFGNWATGGTNNTWARTSEAAATGSWSATDSPGALYQPNTNSWMQRTAAVSLAGKNNCAIAYDLRIQAGADTDFDTLYIEASRDGGASWEPVDYWWGDGGTTFYALESDMSFLDGSPSVLVRFRLFTDAADPVQMQGVHLDNIRVGCAGAGGGVNDYNTISGTSMASPHVAGVAALAWAKNSGVSVTTVKNAILNGGDAIASLSGKTVTGRRLNANGTLALIPSPAAHTLTVSKNGSGTGTVTSTPAGIACGSDCTEPYPAGTSVTLTATVPAGSHFASWTGCDSVVGVTCTVQLSSNKTVTATFDPGTFSDVPTSHPFYTHIEQMFARGITNGCSFNPTTGERNYCPLNNVTRQEMAVFIVRAKGLGLLTPTMPTFSDVPASHMFYGHIERFFAEGITTGCFYDPGTGERRYCPLNQVTRQEMAVFIVRAKGLGLLTPATPTFSDVPASHMFYGHIERFFADGITQGCYYNPSTGERRYCPLDNVTREAMAAFIIRAFPS